MRTIRLIVAYDGTELSGYQKQDNAPTVQGFLETALSKVCNEAITIYGSSRTDAGVHAKYQVVAFQTTGSIPVENLTRALIAHLPKYIVIREAHELPEDWRPRGNIWGKEYMYTIHNSPIEDPLTLRYHWHIKKPLDVMSMIEGAQYLVGTRDFTSLKGANTTPADPVKTIHAVTIHHMGESLCIHVVGDGFLYHMVRNIAGLLVDIGQGRKKPSDVEPILAAKNRKLYGKTAPAQGLCLEKVFFTEEAMLERVRELQE